MSLPKNYRYKYEVADQFGNWLHMYSLVGRWGATHFHFTDYGENRNTKYFQERYGAGGREVHYRVPPPYMKDDPPSHDVCPFLHAPCWHDGSSLYAAEVLLPHWLLDPTNHESMFRLLAYDADEVFSKFSLEDEDA